MTHKEKTNKGKQTRKTTGYSPNATIDIFHLVQLCFVGLIGANNEIEKVLKNFHEEYDKPSHGFLFYEYLLHQPLHRKQTYNNNFTEERWIIHPFIYRTERRSLVMIKPEDAENGTLDFKFFEEEDISKADILVKLDDSIFSKSIYEYWQKEESDKLNEKIKYIGDDCNLIFQCLEEPFIKSYGSEKPFFAITENLTTKFIRDSIPTHMKKLKGISKKSYGILYGIIYPQFACLSENQQITSLLIPIASSQIYYGNLFVHVPHFKLKEEDNNYKEENLIKIKKLASELIKCVKRNYISAIAFIHEHFFENLLMISKKGNDLNEKDIIRKYYLKSDKIKITYSSPICRSKDSVSHCYECEHFGWEESSDNTVEQYLHKLWQDRRTKRTNIRESLLFRNRLYSDPNMLYTLEGFLKPSKAKLKKDGDLLPCILVVATPGSGKEAVPKLLKLFSDCYNRGKIYKLNMASLKPDAVAPLAMVGGEIRLEKKGRLKLVGIFNEIRKETQR